LNPKSIQKRRRRQREDEDTIAYVSTRPCPGTYVSTLTRPCSGTYVSTLHSGLGFCHRKNYFCQDSGKTAKNW